MLKMLSNLKWKMKRWFLTIEMHVRVNDENWPSPVYLKAAFFGKRYIIENSQIAPPDFPTSIPLGEDEPVDYDTIAKLLGQYNIHSVYIHYSEGYFERKKKRMEEESREEVYSH